jgi:hypothetical protein
VSNFTIEDVSRDVAKEFRQFLRASGLDPTSINQYLKTLKAAFNCPEAQELLDCNPFQDVSVSDPAHQGNLKGAYRPYRRSELLIMIPKSKTCLLGAMMTALNIGSRTGDTGRLKIGDANYDDAFVGYYNRKGKRDMQPPVLPEYLDFFREFLLHHPTPGDPEAFLFWDYGRLENPGVQIGKDIHPLLTSLGLRDPNKEKPKGCGNRRYELCFHNFRATWDTASLMSKMPNAITRHILGHNNPKTGELYNHIGFPEARRALYKAVGKEELLNQKMNPAEPFMDLEGISEVTAFATQELRRRHHSQK